MMDDFNNMINRFRGDGPYLIIDDVKYIDAASGTFNLPLGYTNERIAKKLKEQIDRCCHLSSQYTLDLSNYILKKLMKHTPQNIDNIWLRDISGSGAVECAIRMAQKYTKKSGVVSLFLSHHGQSLATAQISGNAFRLENFSINIGNSFKLPTPKSMTSSIDGNIDYVDDTNMEDFYQFASSGNIACFIIEPILGNGGNIVLSKKFYKKIRKFCDDHDIVLIADEVQTGFGRTGDFFASNGHAKELKPDIIVFAKGAGGIGIPTGGVLMTKKLDILEKYEHSSTSGANPLSLVALNEVIDIIEDENILENVKENEMFLRTELLSLQEKYNFITDVRGVGYMYGFDTPTPETADKIIQLAAKHGLIIRGARYGKSRSLKVRPPLISTQSHLKEIIHALDNAFSEFSLEFSK